MMSERLIQAMKLVVEEQEEIRKIVETQGKIIETQGFAIANLEKKVQELRDCAIKAEIANGVPTKPSCFKIPDNVIESISNSSKTTSLKKEKGRRCQNLRPFPIICIVRSLL